MYLQNKYSNWYFNIIKQARTRLLSGYAEKHHIIPKSLGGNNTKDNLVALTAREHFVCHLLLTRMTTGEARKKMVFAVFYLTGKGKSNRDNRVKNSRLYYKLKQDLCEIVSLQHKGRKRPGRSVEYKLKQTKAKLGSMEAQGAVATVFGEAFASFLEESPDEAKAIISITREQLVEINNAGTGLILIKRDVFEKIILII